MFQISLKPTGQVEGLFEATGGEKIQGPGTGTVSGELLGICTICVCEVAGRSRSSSASYGINSIQGQLLKGSSVYMRIFPTSGLSSCLPREGNRMRLPVLFVVV